MSVPVKEIIRITNLRKDFYQGSTSISAVRGINLSITTGDYVAIMGASGSGKSTLLHLVAGLIQPTSGTIIVEGANIGAMSDSTMTKFRRRKMGLVFQSYNLLPHLTAAQNIMLPVIADGGKELIDSERMSVFIHKLEIENQLRQYPDTLSGGQQQRIALARALAINPPILLADEPTGNLDSVSSQKICSIFDQLCREDGRTIVLVTHEPAVAVGANRIIILADGKILTELSREDFPAAFKDAHELAAVYQEFVLQAKSNKEENQVKDSIHKDEFDTDKIQEEGRKS